MGGVVAHSPLLDASTALAPVTFEDLSGDRISKPPPKSFPRRSRCGKRALYTRSVCVAWVGLHGLACHPWPCMLLKLRFVADSIPCALTKFQWFSSPCAPSALR